MKGKTGNRLIIIVEDTCWVALWSPGFKSRRPDEIKAVLTSSN